MRVTAKMIATEAGVSEATVSLILNGRTARISEKTRRKVLDIADKYKFSCNRIAVSLATRKTKTIGLILPNLTNPLFPRIAASVEKIAQMNDYALFLCNCEESASLFLNYLKAMQSRCIDGLIILLPSEIDEKREQYYETIYHAMHQCNVPIILVEREMHGMHFDFVGLDNKMGGRMAAEYLLKCGHRKIGHVTGTPYFAKRTEGFLEKLVEHGIQLEENYIVNGDFSVESGYTGAKKLLKQNITAIFAGNDRMALGAYRAISECGLRVPEDISLIGFDDDPISEAMLVPLTTIRQSGETMGKKACELLLSYLEEETEIEKGNTYLIAPTFIERKSVKVYKNIDK
ncbi:MAG: LacI family DNA-binding transcriptional regulator [Lachnospiraceae bacterium]|nr:LacI family DNA-binding transcriptional regulator [Lachnospiraceae bacterium]